jgi:hypothetical protein
VDAAAKLKALTDLGLRRLGIHDATVEMAAVQPGGDPEPLTVKGLNLVAHLGRSRIGLNADADHWAGAGLEATNLVLKGIGDDKGFRITRSNAVFNGGKLAANGAYVAEGGNVALKVHVQDLPLQSLSPELGIPKEWAVNGNVSGDVDIDATSGRLRRVDGTVSLARGFIQRSQAVFPWQRASARVNWQRTGITLRDINLQGNGIQLTGAATVGGKAEDAITIRPYSANGRIRATRAEAVASLAQLLTFSTPVPGPWSVADATVDFKANGIVGDLEKSAATGHVTANGLTLQVGSGRAPLVIRTVQSDVQRSSDRLVLRNFRGTADGMSAQGDLSIIPTHDKVAGTFTTQGKVDIQSLTTFRQQLPDAAFWKWIEPSAPGSRGELSFKASGPTAAPEKIAGTGAFRFRSFYASVPASANGPSWKVPIRDLTGAMRIADERLALSDVTLKSELFTAGANLVLSELAHDVDATGTIHMVSPRWRELPPLTGRLPKSLSGGVLFVDARLPAGPEQGGKPLTGAARLEGATYAVALRGKQITVPLQSAAASFRLEGERVTVPSYRVVSTHFTTSGSGATSQSPQNPARWLLHGAGKLSASNAGALFQALAGTSMVEGGKLAADYTFDAPSDRPAEVSISGKARLVDAQPVLPSGALPFSAGDARIKSLTGAFTHGNGTTRFSDLVWVAPRFQASANGTYQDGAVDARMQLSTRQWHEIAGELARTLPVSGGVLTVDAHVRGPLRSLKESPLEGSATLHGARLASDRNASVPVDGGLLDLKANVRGTLGRIAASDVNGTFKLQDVGLTPLRKGAKAVRIEHAGGAFARQGTRVLLSDLEAVIPGARLTGRGELTGVGTGKAAHSFTFQANGKALAGLLPAIAPLPGTATGGRFNGTLELSGTAVQRLAKLEGRAEVNDLQWTAPGQTVPLKVRSATAHVTRTGNRAVLDQVELRMDGGTASLSGEMVGLGGTAAPSHTLRARWSLDDASAWAGRFFPVPGTFTGGTFSGDALIQGTTAEPARTASGRFKLVDTGFMPPKQVLGGPVRPITVYTAGSTFTRANKQTKLNDLTMRTAVGNVTGTIVSSDRGIATIDARGEIEKLEALVDLWPGFKDRIRGGRGELTMGLRGPLRHPRQMAGSILIAGRDGALTVENVDELYAVQPFDELSLLLGLEPDGRVKVTSAKMRGPKANLDGKGLIRANGKLHIEGKAWLTQAYTKKLVKPKILWPIAKLVGYKQIKSAWELDGSLREAKLDLGITDSLLWKVAIKKRVPEPLRKIATGDAPVWSADPPTKVAGK